MAKPTCVVAALGSEADKATDLDREQSCSSDSRKQMQLEKLENHGCAGVEGDLCMESEARKE